MPDPFLHNKNSDFTIHNIPFGIFSVKNERKRLATILNDQVVDLFAVAELGYFNDLKIKKSVFKNDYLNDFISLGKEITHAVRKRLQAILADDKNIHHSLFTIHHSKVKLHLPVKIGDYTDFYSSEEHATNVGKMFRDPAHALLPNWKHLPVAYHGRASSICVSGTNFYRPKGQIKVSENEPPIFSPTKSLDFELEMAAIIGKPNPLGEPISTAHAEDHIFGFVIFNDWSARDIQRWEYVPLGPFLAKNFFSSMSPWVVTIEALDNFRTKGVTQEPSVLPYLQYEGNHHFDVALEVAIQPQNADETVVSKTNFKNLYWNICQQIAHHTVNGCNLNVGDVLASGTISGKEADSFGSMLELTWGGTTSLSMADGSERKFIHDYDTVIMRAYAEKNGVRVGFGEVKNQVLP